MNCNRCYFQKGRNPSLLSGSDLTLESPVCPSNSENGIQEKKKKKEKLTEVGFTLQVHQESDQTEEYLCLAH